MEIQVARPDDYEGLMKLLGVLNPLDTVPERTAGLDCYLRILDSNEFILLVGKLKGEVVATCYLNVIPNLTRSLSPYALIENVVTSAEVRRRGLGKAIVLAAVEKARVLGCYKVMLLTGRDADTHTFYEACGFSKTEKAAFVIRL